MSYLYKLYVKIKTMQYINLVKKRYGINLVKKYGINSVIKYENGKFINSTYICTYIIHYAIKKKGHNNMISCIY